MATPPDADFTDAVVAVIQRTRPGDVVTYGEVAAEAGYPGAARAVGNVLKRVPGLPWWRIVSSAGRLIPGLETEHAQRLRSEGIRVSKGRIRSWPGYRWLHEDLDLRRRIGPRP